MTSKQNKNHIFIIYFFFIPFDLILIEILYFFNRQLKLSDDCSNVASSIDVELQAYKFNCEPEQLRSPRLVRVAVVQNAIPLSPSDPVDKQRSALHDRISSITALASKAGANIICFQETWRELIFILIVIALVRL